MSYYFPVPTERLIYFYLLQSLYYFGKSLYFLAPEYIVKALKSILNRIFSDVSIELFRVMIF